jgi:hypothetical protein
VLFEASHHNDQGKLFDQKQAFVWRKHDIDESEVLRPSMELRIDSSIRNAKDCRGKALVGNGNKCSQTEILGR